MSKNATQLKCLQFARNGGQNPCQCAIDADLLIEKARTIIAEQKGQIETLFAEVSELKAMIDLVMAHDSNLIDSLRDALSGSPVPEVGGRRVETTLANLEHRAKQCIATEQDRPNPDNALIAVLCDTVRLVREHCDTQQIIPTPEPATCEHSEYHTDSLYDFMRVCDFCGHCWVDKAIAIDGRESS